jgi:hypothetical protein
MLGRVVLLPVDKMQGKDQYPYNMSRLQNGPFAQQLRYIQNFILGILTVCLW